MSFEFVNVSIIFQNYVNKILRFFLNRFVLIYLNDILIYIDNENDDVKTSLKNRHENEIKQMLKTLKKHNLYCKFNKCKFHVDVVNFLNFHVFVANIFMQKTRIFTIVK